MSCIDVKELTEDELRQLRNRVVNELYKKQPVKKVNRNEYQKKWTQERRKNEEYREKMNQTSRDWMRKKYAEDEEYRELQKARSKVKYQRLKEKKMLEKESNPTL